MGATQLHVKEALYLLSRIVEEEENLHHKIEPSYAGFPR
jgi:hypothetical protein